MWVIDFDVDVDVDVDVAYFGETNEHGADKRGFVTTILGFGAPRRRNFAQRLAAQKPLKMH